MMLVRFLDSRFSVAEKHLQTTEAPIEVLISRLLYRGIETKMGESLPS